MIDQDTRKYINYLKLKKKSFSHKILEPIEKHEDTVS